MVGSLVGRIGRDGGRKNREEEGGRGGRCEGRRRKVGVVGRWMLMVVLRKCYGGIEACCL